MDEEKITASENNENDMKELLNLRKEQLYKRDESLFKTDEKEKAIAIERMEKEQELENAVKPFVSTRKVIIGICIFMWFFAVFCLITGTLEMNMFMPMCLVALCALAGINVPIFLKKKQMKDMMVAIFAAAICFFLAVVIFVFG